MCSSRRARTARLKSWQHKELILLCAHEEDDSAQVAAYAITVLDCGDERDLGAFGYGVDRGAGVLLSLQASERARRTRKLNGDAMGELAAPEGDQQGLLVLGTQLRGGMGELAA